MLNESATLDGEPLSAGQIHRLLAALRRNEAMPPWEENTYFLDPEYVVIPGGKPSQVLFSADVHTVALLYSVTAPSGFFAFLATNRPATQGWQLSSTNGVVWLRQADVGSIVTQDWFVSTQAGVVFTAARIKLRHWPTIGGK